MPTLRRKPADLQAWHLVDLSAMAEAFSALTADGWRGGISAGSDGAMRLELNADQPTRQIIAKVGDWLVLDIDLRQLSAQDFADNYEIAEGS